MKTSSFNTGIRTGVVFWIVIVTIFLIGFTVTGAGLIGKLFGESSSFSITSLTYYSLFMILVGVWAGAAASPRPLVGPDTLKQALAGGVSA